MAAVNAQVAFEQRLRTACVALAERCAPIRRLIVAYSGGCDSTALLHALTRSQHPNPVQLCAIHVNHQLQPHSAEWAEHCRVQCRGLGIACEIVTIASRPQPGESVEAWARTARYAALALQIAPTDLLLTAHHRDDQAETLLLNALRGAGPDGLQGIAPLRRLGVGWLGRPCLEFGGEELRSYATAQRLEWIEDPTNQAPSFDRNYLRREVVPVLQARWPSMTTTLARAASLQRTAASALYQQAETYLAHSTFRSADSLHLDVLGNLPHEWQAVCLRHWIAARGHPRPTAAQLERILSCVLGARRDREPAVEWKRSGIRRYGDTLYLYAALAKPPRNDPVAWDLTAPLNLPGGVLTATREVDTGIRSAQVAAGSVTVCFRHGGERCRPAGRAHSQTLKRLLQERRIPPWQRANLPMVYVGEALAAVADLWVCAEFMAKPGEIGWVMTWKPAG